MLISNDDKSEKGRILEGWHLSIVLLVLSMAILGLIVLASADFKYTQLKSLFAHLGLVLILGLLMLSIVNFILRSIRWHLYSRRLGLPINFRDSIIYYMAGFSMGVTPGRMGELIRLWLLRHGRGFNYTRTLPLLIADRVNDLLAILVLTVCAGLLTNFASLLYIMLAFLLIVVANVILRHPGCLLEAVNVLYRYTRRWHKLFASARRTLRLGRRMYTFKDAVIASTVSIAAWFAECIAFYLLLSTLGTNLAIESATFIYMFATLIGALSFLPGGLGGFEATAVIMLKANGVDLGTAVFATSVIRLTTLWFSVALGSYLLSYVLLRKGVTDD